MTYEQVLEDYEYLWRIDEANDMTGGYVDQGDLFRLLRNPTKAMAKKCLLDQMQYWFQVGIERGTSSLELAEEDPNVRIIAERYGFKPQ